MVSGEGLVFRKRNDRKSKLLRPFLSLLPLLAIYIRDVRGFDKLRDCRRVKDIRAKVFTSFSACFQILFLPCILVPCIIRVEIVNIKKKWSGKGGFLARIHAKKISNFTSEEYNLVCTSISIYSGKVGGSIRFAFSVARLHIFSRGKVIAHRHLPRLAHCL